jgi:hypothetical protein
MCSGKLITKTCKRDVRMSNMGGIMHTIMYESQLEKNNAIGMSLFKTYCRDETNVYSTTNNSVNE